MANPHRGEVEIILDKPRIIKYSTNSLAELENKLGYTFPELQGKPMGFQTMIKVFWAGLIENYPDITLREAADLMDYEDYETIEEKVSESLEKFFNKRNNTKKNSQVTKKTKNGKNSTGTS